VSDSADVRPAMLAGALALAAGLVAGMLHPTTLSYAHRIIEEVIH